jgi:hypothetical protein
MEGKQRRPESERLRQRCNDLDPLVNRPGDVDELALAELRSMAASARKETYLDVAKMLEDFVDGIRCSRKQLQRTLKDILTISLTSR